MITYSHHTWIGGSPTHKLYYTRVFRFLPISCIMKCSWPGPLHRVAKTLTDAVTVGRPTPCFYPREKKKPVTHQHARVCLSAYLSSCLHFHMTEVVNISANSSSFWSSIRVEERSPLSGNGAESWIISTSHFTPPLFHVSHHAVCLSAGYKKW